MQQRPAYTPKPAEIAETCRRIREEGFVDYFGDVHAPWPRSRLLGFRKGIYRVAFKVSDIADGSPQGVDHE